MTMTISGSLPPPVPSPPQVIWVALIHSGYGEDTMIQGAYESREAAFEGLRDMPNMTVWVDLAGHVRGRPRRERTGIDLLRRWPNLPEKWAEARPWTVQGRAAISVRPLEPLAERYSGTVSAPHLGHRADHACHSRRHAVHQRPFLVASTIPGRPDSTPPSCLPSRSACSSETVTCPPGRSAISGRVFPPGSRPAQPGGTLMTGIRTPSGR